MSADNDRRASDVNRRDIFGIVFMFIGLGFALAARLDPALMWIGVVVAGVGTVLKVGSTRAKVRQSLSAQHGSERDRRRAEVHAVAIH
jgi:hypothetical protein